jgi:hypothetical protein
MVFAAAGRRIDPPGAPVSRFGLSEVGRVRAEIAHALRRHSVTTLIASAACGSDLLALDAATAAGIRCRIVLPFDPTRFRHTSVVDRPGDWGPLYDRLLQAATATGDVVTIATDPLDDDDAYRAATDAILDDAIEVAAGCSEPAAALVVWEGRSRGAGDLTELFRDQARARGLLIVEVLTTQAG